MAGCTSSGLRITRAMFPMDRPTSHEDRLTIGNTILDVDVTQSYENGTVTESIKTHGEEVDKEQYQLHDSGLSLVEASDDKFDPPLPLFKFPAGGIQSFNWTGWVQEGPTSRQANAKISVKPQEIAFNNHEEPGISVDVALSIDSGTPVPSERTFTFWITSNGIVKRSFGAGTTRAIEGLSGN